MSDNTATRVTRPRVAVVGGAISGTAASGGGGAPDIASDDEHSHPSHSSSAAEEHVNDKYNIDNMRFQQALHKRKSKNNNSKVLNLNKSMKTISIKSNKSKSRNPKLTKRLTMQNLRRSKSVRPVDMHFKPFSSPQQLSSIGVDGAHYALPAKFPTFAGNRAPKYAQSTNNVFSMHHSLLPFTNNNNTANAMNVTTNVTRSGGNEFVPKPFIIPSRIQETGTTAGGGNNDTVQGPSPHLALENPNVMPLMGSNPHIMRRDISAAFIGHDGMIHTPKGGIYPKTSEAVAHFRQNLKYDELWERRRKVYVILILILMFCTVTLVIVILVPRDVTYHNIQLLSNTHICHFNFTLPHNTNNNNNNNDNDNDNNIVTHHDMQVTNLMLPQYNNTTNAGGVGGDEKPDLLFISTLFEVDVDNENWVPATVNSWQIQYYIQCISGQSPCICDDVTTFGCPVGTIHYQDGDFQLHKSSDDVYAINSTAMFSYDNSSLVYQEWAEACEGEAINSKNSFKLNLELSISLSFALQAKKVISDDEIVLEVNCNGTGRMLSNGIHNR